MSKYNNSAKIFTGSTGGELRISLKDTRQTINATNNRAQYYAELAEKYKNEAKEHRDNAQYYAEQNSDVTFEYIDSVKESLEGQIATKQDNGDYALRSELPTKVSELDNDLEYTSFDAVIPSQIGNENKVLCTDGEKLFWNTNSSYKLFDIKILDYVLNYEESQGWALQGTYVYKEALAGTRYGYPDFYAKCLEEYQEATGTETVNGVTIKVNSNGHKFYNIADKSAIDSFFNNKGTAWFYGVDTENERIFLPRDKFVAVNNIARVVGNGERPQMNYYNGSTLEIIGTGELGYINGSSSPSYDYIKLGGVEASTNNSIIKFTEQSGLEAQLQPQENKYLYICVGNTTSYEGITEVVNQGVEILEQVNQAIESRVKLDGSNAEFPYVIETYVNGTSWYRVYSDGWCEQGGYVDAQAVATTTISLLKPYSNVQYTILLTNLYTGNEKNAVHVKVVTQSSFTYFSENTNGNAYWQACGYIA